jgi:hypothetical protein
MKLGSKGNAPSSFMEQLAKEGEVTTAPPVSKPGATAVSEPVQTIREPIEVTLVESIAASYDREGALNQFTVQGELIVNVTAESAVRNRILLSNKSNLQLRIHPNVNRDLFLQKSVLGLKDDQTAYRLNTPTSVFKWRHQSDNEDDLPIKVHCWPSVSGDGSVVANVDYQLTAGHELVDFTLAIPIVGKNAPTVTCSEGSHQFDQRQNILRWAVPIINDSNPRGELTVEVAQWDNSHDTNWLFPITVTFTGRSTFADITVEAAKSASGENLSMKFVKELKVERYAIGEKK